MIKVHDGDLIAVSGKGVVSGVINLATFGLPGVGASHVGIVCHHAGTPLVYETTSFDRPPCALTGKRVRGCQAHRYDDYLKFVDGKIWVYPIRRELYHDEADRLQRCLDADLGTPYDAISAIRSGGFAYRILQAMLHPEDTSGLFCSEWCAKALVEIGLFRTSNYSKWNPNRLLRVLTRWGYYNHPVREK